MEQKTKYILYGLGTVGAIGTGAFFYLQYQKKQANKNSITDAFSTASLPLPAPSTSGGKSNSNGTSGTFPLKKGSRGALVKNLQNTLIKKFGVRILPRYGADGSFGTETLNALISKGLTAVITSEIFSKLILGDNSSSPQFSLDEQLSDRLREAVISGSFSRAIQALKQIKSTDHYQRVGDFFKRERIGTTRKTIVTALLYRFYASSQKKQINTEFYRIGLKYDGSKWALKGLGGLIDQLVTIESTKVWDGTGQTMNVPIATILGEYLDANNGVTEFETLDRKRLFVKTTAISYTS